MKAYEHTQRAFLRPVLRHCDVAFSLLLSAAFLSATVICDDCEKMYKTRQSKQCGFSIYTFDNLKSNSMVRLVRAEKMVLSGLVFARKIARMILIQNI